MPNQPCGVQNLARSRHHVPAVLGLHVEQPHDLGHIRAPADVASLLHGLEEGPQDVAGGKTIHDVGIRRRGALRRGADAGFEEVRELRETRQAPLGLVPDLGIGFGGLEEAEDRDPHRGRVVGGLQGGRHGGGDLEPGLLEEPSPRRLVVDRRELGLLVEPPRRARTRARASVAVRVRS